jgi:tripartite-type tricarboxylate transporter receptor subunit TctC
MLKPTISTLSIACAAFFASTLAHCDEYPSRPIQVIVPYAGGSGSDITARVVFERMSASMGQRFVVDNRPAAGGVVGTQAITKAPPDGYNLLFSASGPLAINKVMLRNLPYDPEKDFEPISFVALLPNIFAVSGKLPV